jgi:2-polyprenyl-3-methyl-5-hydroxy-6-metoxy-1,4-benzoquinol methylase
MKTDFERKYHSVEEKHWWFVGRREIILKLIKQKFPQRKDIKILEIGCSGGPLLSLLLSQGYSQVAGIDNSKKAITLCEERGLKNVFFMEGTAPHFDSEQFDVIIASDVLEHIQNGKRAVKAWQRIVKKGGIIICFVPALRILWSKHDEDNKHYKRYTKKNLEYLFAENNSFTIVRSSYWNIALFLPILFFRFFMRLLASKSSASQLRHGNNFINILLIQLLRIENTLLSMGINYPIGVSVFVIAQKAEEV